MLRGMIMFGPFDPGARVDAAQDEEEKEYREYDLWGGPAPVRTDWSDNVEIFCCDPDAGKAGGEEKFKLLYDIGTPEEREGN